MKDLKPVHRLAKSLGCAADPLAFQCACTEPTVSPAVATAADSLPKPRVIVTSDGEIDDHRGHMQ